MALLFLFVGWLYFWVVHYLDYGDLRLQIEQSQKGLSMPIILCYFLILKIIFIL